ncbi:MAG: hypothetical protein HYW48_12335 [Deltaproteobacteria bacterium]|nr:hypothetical protein [Deltaproteobacteria bacterium]
MPESFDRFHTNFFFCFDGYCPILGGFEAQPDDANAVRNYLRETLGPECDFGVVVAPGTLTNGYRLSWSELGVDDNTPIKASPLWRIDSGKVIVKYDAHGIGTVQERMEGIQQCLAKPENEKKVSLFLKDRAAGALWGRMAAIGGLVVASLASFYIVFQMFCDLQFNLIRRCGSYCTNCLGRSSRRIDVVPPSAPPPYLAPAGVVPAASLEMLEKMP